MRAVLVSRNEHKARELRAALPEWAIELVGADELPEEVGGTFVENALAKARFGRAVGEADAWTLGEDSGLEVEGLGGRPGVRSARYGGPAASDAENVAKLLGELEGIEGDGRRARYVCALVAISPRGETLETIGTLAGRIAHETRGGGGFGYDPVFVPEGETKTVAELGDAWKSKHSHRGQAARALGERLRSAAPAL